MFQIMQKQSLGGVRQRGNLKMFVKFTGKHLCESLFIKKETLVQVFSCEFCEIFIEHLVHRTRPVADSDNHI